MHTSWRINWTSSQNDRKELAKKRHKSHKIVFCDFCAFLWLLLFRTFRGRLCTARRGVGDGIRRENDRVWLFPEWHAVRDSAITGPQSRYSPLRPGRSIRALRRVRRRSCSASPEGTSKPQQACPHPSLQESNARRNVETTPGKHQPRQAAAPHRPHVQGIGCAAEHPRNADATVSLSHSPPRRKDGNAWGTAS